MLPQRFWLSSNDYNSFPNERTGKYWTKNAGIVPWGSRDYPKAWHLAGIVPYEYLSSHWSTRILTKSWRTLFFFTENTPNSLLFRGLRVKERIVCMKGDAFNFVPLNFQDPHWEVKMHPWPGFGSFQKVISCPWLLASKKTFNNKIRN